jgi:hypothetical protein
MANIHTLSDYRHVAQKPDVYTLILNVRKRQTYDSIGLPATEAFNCVEKTSSCWSSVFSKESQTSFKNSSERKMCCINTNQEVQNVLIGIFFIGLLATLWYLGIKYQ